ncbi:MAG: NAD(P)/FAD-dependent oxidoreductase [Pseudorhodobacter sp.]|nr:NAD(P)/FAD-dependent oxidoreductase [Frankiaceae bacterium]
MPSSPEPISPEPSSESGLREVDAVVVGGGAAGLAAALWLARYRRSVVVLDSGDYRAASVEASHGYLGRDPQKPMDLLARGREELLAYPTASLVRGRADTAVRRADGCFEVAGLLAQRLVLATGVVDTFPSVEGFAEHYGASVFHCPACDGYEARDRDVVALGWDARLVGFSLTLLNWARSITVVTDGHAFEGDGGARGELAGHGVEVLERDAVRLLGSRGDLRGLCLDDGRELLTSLVFFSVNHTPQVDLAATLGCALDAEGYVVVDAQGQITVPGVYAAGDLTPGLQLVQVAAASGTVAGVGAAQSLLGSAGSPTAPRPGPAPA